MKESVYYVKLVEWSEADQCFIGQCPGIIGPCCHGDDEEQVYHALCLIVDEWIDIMKKDAKPLPPMTSGINISRLILEQVGAAAHHARRP